MLEQIRVDAIQFAVSTGTVVKSSRSPEDPAFHHCSVSLNPCPYPVKIYNQLIKVQESVGHLYAKLCSKPESTIQILEDSNDEFIQKLI